jgi:hypothetical protein
MNASSTSFTFDYVYDPRYTQGDIYEDCVQALVDSFFAGYNASIIAYGQTGSGKTFST